MTEIDSVVKSFNEKFSDLKNKKIALYGISKNTQILLEHCTGYNFLGIMDGYQNDGTIYGKDILSLDDVIDLQIDTIIIVARVSSAKIIYRRISEFCNENNINVFDVNGSNFSAEGEITNENNEYFELGEEQLITQIINHNAISFDIFDTLIMRQVLYPTDVFELVKRNIDKKLSVDFDFVKSRAFAEQQLVTQNPTYDMIYDNLQTNVKITDEEKEYLKKLEFEIERTVLVPRKKMIEIFEYARDNKEVYLVSDMYYTTDKLEEILRENGVVGYKELLVSCEHGNRKTEKLFENLKEQIGEKTCLHIGDNYEADVVSAKRNGITPFGIFSASDMLEISSYKELLNYTSSFERRCLVGLFIEKAFNNPFALYKSAGRLKVTNPYDLGYLFIAPLLSEFVKWLFGELKNSKFDKVLFLARDGFIVEKLYNDAIERLSLNDLPQSQYFLTSRIMCIASTIFNDNDILEVMELAYNGTPEDLLKNRFLLDDIDISKKGESQSIKEYVLQHRDKILSKSKELRNNYKKYANKIGVNFDEQIAVFDFYATGTCQMCLEEVFEQKLKGFYFVRIDATDEKRRNLDIKALFNYDEISKNRAFISEGYIFLESILTSPDTTLKEFNFTGDAVHLREKRDNKQIEELSMIHQGIRDYFDIYLKLMWSFKPMIKETDKILGLILNKYTEFHSISIIEKQIDDDFFNRTYSFKDLLF